MQTSIEWLLEKIEQKNGTEFSSYYVEFIEQAKEIHYHETKKVCEFWHGKYIPKPIFDEYYSKTFKKDYL
jgi:hypothetical protein